MNRAYLEVPWERDPLQQVVMIRREGGIMHQRGSQWSARHL